MNLGGLSPDKAPPAEAPFSLFYLMPVFLGLAGLVLAWQGEQVLASRWSPAALAATHFLVLGALAPVMCGALLQISPVLLGAPYPRVRLVARLTAAGLALGSLLIGVGFLFAAPQLLLVGGIAAALGLSVFLIASLMALPDVAGRHHTLWAVRLALLALAVTILLGLGLAMARAGWWVPPQPLRLVDAHVAWGLAGWVGVLLAGVGMQLLPLFYLSPPFSGWIRRLLPLSLFGLLLLVSAVTWLPPLAWHPQALLIAAIFLVYLVYNTAALYAEAQRQRPHRDAPLWLWQFSHVAVFFAFFAWLAGLSDSLLGILLLGAALSFVIGSLLKIVPFLGWLDLQQRRIAGGRLQVSLPRLRKLLPQGYANAVALTFGAAVVAALAGAVAPVSIRVGGGLLSLCAIILGYALIRQSRLRRSVIRRFASLDSAI